MRDDALLTRPCLEIDLEAIAANWRALARFTAPAECAAVVKADAYGLGLAPVARALARAGCRSFFVARPEEGAELRALLPEARIFVLDGLALRPAAFFLEARLEPVLGSPRDLHAWLAECRRTGTRAAAAVLVDTGLTRLGCDPAELVALESEARAAVALLVSHLACADEPAHPLNARQLARLKAVCPLFPRAKVSLAASSGIFLGPAFHFALVRPGAALYGVNPTPGRPNPMRPVVRLRAPVLHVHQLREAGSVGYGATFPTRPGMRIAVLPVGYADGYPRAAGDRATARIANHVVPVVGRVSMDLLTVDVSDVPPELVQPGTAVELLGAEFGVDALADAAGTIGYEILTRLGRRFERRYLSEE